MKDDFFGIIKDILRRLRTLEQNVSIRNLTLPADGKLVVPNVAGDPTSPVDGQIWYNTVTKKLRGRENGTNVNLV